jgi:hypothetical protein
MSPQLKADLAGRCIGKRFLTVDEYCFTTGESRPTAYLGMRNGRIPHVDDDGRRKIPTSFVDQLERVAFKNAAKRKASV